MRRAVICVAMFGFFYAVGAQDGIYGYFLLGQKFIDFTGLNDQLSAVDLNSAESGNQSVEFPMNNLTLGGGGHLLLAERLMLGGKAFGVFHERVVPDSDPNRPDRRVKIAGGMGVGQAGFSILKPNRIGLKLYPQLGLGLASFMLQTKTGFDGDANNMDNILASEDDRMVMIQKTGLAIDVCAGLDWYKPFKNFFTIVPGLDVGPLLHIEVGYTFVPVKTHWMRDVDDLDRAEPDIQFEGLYLNAGLGIGLSAED
jgi:hypothetical protein